MIRALLLWALCATAAPASAQCRQALALGLDASGSVDTREYRLQLGRLAAALRHRDVVRALLAQPGAPVRLAVYEWSGTAYQRLLLDWTEIRDRATLEHAAGRLAATTRAPAPPGTALGAAMQYGAALLDRQPECWKRTLDISGDGRHNMGPHPRDVKSALAGRATPETAQTDPAGQSLPLTLNALAIGADAPRAGDTGQAATGALSAYFRAWVILGPDAFVETAQGFEDYQAAMIRKLLRELETPALSALAPLPGQSAPPLRPAQ